MHIVPKFCIALIADVYAKWTFLFVCMLHKCLRCHCCNRLASQHAKKQNYHFFPPEAV